MTYNRTEREAFACLQAHGRQTLAQILAHGDMTTQAPETLRHALGTLVRRGLAQHLRAWRQPGSWELLPDAVMPPGKVRALRPDDCPPQRIIYAHGDVPGAVLERIGLAGLCRQMTEG